MMDSIKNVVPTPTLQNSVHQGGDVGAVLGTGASTALSAVSGGALSPGALGGLVGGLAGGGGGDGMARFERLLSLQMQTQAEMQSYSTKSNIAKTRHDTAMTSIRNMRA